MCACVRGKQRVFCSQANRKFTEMQKTHKQEDENKSKTQARQTDSFYTVAKSILLLSLSRSRSVCVFREIYTQTDVFSMPK